MGKKKELKDYLPTKNLEPLVPVQAKIPASLHSEVFKALAENNLTFKDLIVASMRKFLDDMKRG